MSRSQRRWWVLQLGGLQWVLETGWWVLVGAVVGAPTAVPSPACARSGVQRGADGCSRRGAVAQLAGGVRQGPGLHLGAARGRGQAHHAGRPCVSAGMAAALGWRDRGVPVPPALTSPTPQAAAGHRGRADLLRWGRPDGTHPGPVHGCPRPLQALRLHCRCHCPVSV